MRLTAPALAGVIMGTPAFARPAGGDVFEQLAGSWSGGGRVQISGGGTEQLRCRASYRPAGPRLSLALTCASDSFKMQISSNVVREGNRISGGWSESSFGASGSVSGSASGDRVEANVVGGGLSARLSITVHGNSQSVVLRSQGQLAGTATVTLRR